MSRNQIPLTLVAWIMIGAIRVAFGSSTSPLAYLFFGLFWLVSLMLLALALRQFVGAMTPEEKIESICICLSLLAIILQGVLGPGAASPIAAIVFFASGIVLVYIYGRRFRRRHLIHP